MYVRDGAENMAFGQLGPRKKTAQFDCDTYTHTHSVCVCVFDSPIGKEARKFSVSIFFAILIKAN